MISIWALLQAADRPSTISSRPRNTSLQPVSASIRLSVASASPARAIAEALEPS
ncbi:MAG: hypothetical protein VKI83_06025 [Synechococcaceae cyanobacterium]|nr:hypothetical protein [Synechococcaceae cyanobacterium]